MATTITLPSNVEAERSVLGSMLISPNASEIALGSLEEDDFSDTDPRNKILFHAMKELHDHDRPIDAQTVIDELIALHLEKNVPSQYLFDLVNTVITPENVDHYIQMVKDQSVLRELLLKFKDIQDDYAKGVPDISTFIAMSNDEISLIAQKRAVQGMRSAKEVAQAVSDKIAKSTAVDNRGLTGVDTGYKKLNEYTHGWHKGDLIILAARPSVGKTALGMNLAYNATFRGKIPVAFFSLEMSAEQIMERLIACRSMVSNDKIQTGNFLSNRDKIKISAAIEEISKTQLYFDDTPNSKLGDILAKAHKLKNSHPDLGLIVIDYMGRIRYSDRPNMSQRQQEISEISGALKTLARELDLPVICLAQLNRDVENTESKIPSLSNLRDSGSIEQDADIAMLLYRPDYYTNTGQSVGRDKKKFGQKDDNPQPMETKTADVNKGQGDVSEIQVIIAKNRNGQTGKVNLVFQKAYSRFDDPSTDYEETMARNEEARRGFGGE